MKALELLNKIYWGFYILILGIVTPITTLINKWDNYLESLPIFILSIFLLFLSFAVILAIGATFMFANKRWVYIVGLSITSILLVKSITSDKVVTAVTHILTDWIPILYFILKLRSYKYVK